MHDNLKVKKMNLKRRGSGRGLLYGTIRSFTMWNLEEKQHFGHALRPL